VEIGASEYALRTLLSNHDAVSIGIFSLPGANAIHISDQVRATMAKLKISLKA
jgi:multidrug efflux pump